MKKILLTIALVLSATFAFAENLIIIPDTPGKPFGSSTGSEKSSMPYEYYIVSDDNGRSRTVGVMKLFEDTYVTSDSNGSSTTIYKPDWSK
uniref:Uncharacterized protein n=1 Tax=viral metagenome TaxID=1070528 RepID=A0A6H1ZJ78_9ZZZZ